MTTVDDVVPWLREQIAEARKLAQRCIEDDAKFSSYDESRILVTRLNVAYHDDYRGTESAKEHAALRRMFDPDAVVAQCDAHEALLDAYENAEARRAQLTEAFTRNLRKIAELEPAEERRRYSEVSTANGLASGYGMAVRMAASSFRHRPGYREEWRP